MEHNKVDIVKVKGGPSLVSVYPKGIDPIDIIEALQTKTYEVSKLIEVVLEKGQIKAKSVQVRSDGSLEYDKNCGNSATAAIFYFWRRNKVFTHCINPVTGFTLSSDELPTDRIGSSCNFPIIIQTEEQDIDNMTITENTHTFDFNGNRETIFFSRVNLANDYIIIDTVNLDNIDPNDLDSKENYDLLKRLKVFRQSFLRENDIADTSEFPKICIAHKEGNLISAKTIYREKFHPGFPISGIVNLSAVYKHQGGTNNFYLQSPQERLQITLEGNCLSSLKIHDRNTTLIDEIRL